MNKHILNYFGGPNAPSTMQANNYLNVLMPAASSVSKDICCKLLTVKHTLAQLLVLYVDGKQK